MAGEMHNRKRPKPPHRVEEEDSADETEHISTRALALTRYRRNHDLMNEVFIHAAFRKSSLVTFLIKKKSFPPHSQSSRSCTTFPLLHLRQGRAGIQSCMLCFTFYIFATVTTPPCRTNSQRRLKVSDVRLIHGD